MAASSIYEQISRRTGGDIYIGVVGPVRSGKSTFIHKFMEEMVIPNIEDENDRIRTVDELPQSGSGRTVTTTEPKFIPSSAIKVNIQDSALKVRMIDCVGYMIDGAIGDLEGEQARQVMTPWSDSPMPLAMAGEIGTERVVKEHSTIAMLVSCDGSICDIPRESYVPAEERIVKELKELSKPFALILNSSNPESESAHALAEELEKKYSAPVALVNCTKINSDDIREILSLVVGEFPIKELRFKLPEWYDLLPEDNRERASITEKISSFATATARLSDVSKNLSDTDGLKLVSLDAAEGSALIDVPVSREVFYSVVAETTGLDVASDRALFSTLSELSEIKRDYCKIKNALCDARERGYGIVMPEEGELRISEPKLTRQSAGFGVKISASADTIHMIRADIKAEVCPVVGTEEQAEEVVRLMLDDYEENPKKLLSTKMLGRSIYDLVSDGMNAKLLHVSDESRGKLGQTLEKIVNEGADGLICILL